MEVKLLLFILSYFILNVDKVNCVPLGQCLQPSEESMQWYRAYNCDISWILKKGVKCYNPPVCHSYCTEEINNAWVTMNTGEKVSKAPNITETADSHGLVIIRYPGYNCSCDPQDPGVPLVADVQFPPAMHCNVSYLSLFPPECLRPTAAELAPYRVYNCYLYWFRIWNKCGKFNCYRPPVCENSCRYVVNNQEITLASGTCQSQPAKKVTVTLPDLTIVVTTQPGWNCCCVAQTFPTKPVGGVPFPPKMVCQKLLPPPDTCLLDPTPQQVALYSTYNCRLTWNVGYGGKAKCYLPPACSNQCQQTINNDNVTLNLGESAQKEPYKNYSINAGQLVITSTPGYHCACVPTVTTVPLLANVSAPPHMECQVLQANTSIPCLTPSQATIKLYANIYCQLSWYNIRGVKCYQPPTCQYKCQKVYNGVTIILNQGEVYNLPKKTVGRITYPGYYCSCDAAPATDTPLIGDVPPPPNMNCHPQ